MVASCRREWKCINQRLVSRMRGNLVSEAVSCFCRKFRVGSSYNEIFGFISQLRPYLVDHTGSRPISKVKMQRALLVLRLVTTREALGAVVFLSCFMVPRASSFHLFMVPIEFDYFREQPHNITKFFGSPRNVIYPLCPSPQHHWDSCSNSCPN